MQDTNDSREGKRAHALPVQPRFISQLSSEAVAGINARRFLELLPRLGVQVIEVGKLRLVKVDEFEAALLRLVSSPAVGEADDDADGQPASADDVLRALGLRRAS